MLEGIALHLDLIIAVTALLTASATIAASISGVRGLRNQLWLQTYTEYTKRYADIMELLPFEARRPGSGFDIESLDEDGRLAILGAFRRYFNMCSEEFWLWSTGRIDAKTWGIWRTGIEEVAKFPNFTYAWSYLSCEYDYFAEFSEFMSQVVGSAPPPTVDSGRSVR